MNKTEALYARELELLRRAGEVTAWLYESVKLRLAKNTWYTPDFMVLTPSGEIEFHEVKGFWRDDARVKVKVVAELYPWFRFVVVRRERGAFVSEEVNP